MGDTQAHAYLADVLMRTGRYAEAREAFGLAPIWENPQDAPWRLSYNVLGLIVEELEIPAQERASLAIPDFYPRPIDDSPGALEATALAAVREDALNGWAYAGLAAAWAGKGDTSALVASVAAALIVNVAPYLWLHLIIDAFGDDAYEDETRMIVVQEAILCAWRNFGEAFADEILENPLLPDDLRPPVLQLFETLRLEKPPMEMREHRKDGTFESFFIPTGRHRSAN